MMEALLQKMKTTDLYANPEEREAVAEQQEVPKKIAVEIIGQLDGRYGDASGRKGPPTAEEADSRTVVRETGS
jgi:hypothetical protein